MEKYPHEPFEFEHTTVGVNEYQRLSGYDLEAATRRQTKFFYNVSLPHYRDPKFLEIAEDRYRKFLHLKRVNRDALLIPCYDIDLVWHTHQLYPIKYNTDTVRILGRMLNHDDTLDDRSQGSVQNRASIKTRELWKTQYHENYAMCGAMYRGECPKGSLVNIRDTIAGTNKSSRCDLQIDVGQYEKCIMPENIEQLWGPVPLPRLPPGTDNNCIAATHRFGAVQKFKMIYAD